MYLGWPQIIYLVLVVGSLFFSLAKHGQPRDDDYNFFSSLVSTLLVLGLLFWGGFFG